MGQGIVQLTSSCAYGHAVNFWEIEIVKPMQ